MPNSAFFKQVSSRGSRHLIGALLVLLAIALPASYFAQAFKTRAATLQTKADIKAELINQLISNSPEMWRYEELRLNELLTRQPAELSDEHGRILSASGETIAESRQPVSGPTLSRRAMLYDAGAIAGALVLQRSIADLLWKTALIAALAVILASAVMASLLRLWRTEQRAADRIFDQQERARVTLQSIGDAVITVNQQGRIDYLNPQAEQLTQWTEAEARGKQLGDILDLIDERTMLAVSLPAFGGSTPAERAGAAIRELAVVRRDGSRVAVEMTSAAMTDRHQHAAGGALVLRDVTTNRRLTRRIHWAASHDSLTKLFNRREIELRVEDAVRSAKEASLSHVFIYLDLDQFKVVNDSCGHVAGDTLLKEIGQIWQPIVGHRDTLARMGGDEFGILLEECVLQHGKLVAERLMGAVRDYRFHWAGKTFNIGASIGVVEINADTISPAEVFSAADTACYSAKEQGRNRIYVYESSDLDLAHRREEMSWANRINQALAEDRFCLYHQTYLALNAGDEDARHIEVLLRLIDEQGKVVAPGVFMPAAERFNLMPAIDRWVIKSVFARYRELSTLMGPGLTCAINLSGASLNAEGTLGLIEELTTEFAPPKGAICFEITETVAINNVRAATQFMTAVKALGHKFALDDFGVGSSSLTYLKSLPVDYLKIDGSFVRNIANDPVDRAMTDTINRVGHIMGLKTVGEFAENESVIAELKAIGVDYAQGYGVQVPQPLPGVQKGETAPPAVRQAPGGARAAAPAPA